MDINGLTSRIIGAAMRVHSELGPGLLESVYQKCMEQELREAGLTVGAEVIVPLRYRGKCLIEDAFRIDLLVEDLVVVELKAVDEVKAVHKKQLLTYLKLAGKPVGLLINFNSVLLKDGIERLVHHLPEQGNQNPSANSANSARDRI